MKIDEDKVIEFMENHGRQGSLEYIQKVVKDNGWLETKILMTCAYALSTFKLSPDKMPMLNALLSSNIYYGIAIGLQLEREEKNAADKS